MSGAPGPRRHRGRAVLRWTLRIVAVVLIGLGALVFAATRAPVALPDWVTGRLAAAIDAGVKGSGFSVSLEGVGVDFRQILAPAFVVDGLKVGDSNGTPLLTLDQITAIVALRRLAAGQIAPTALRARGATLSLGRDAEGRLSLQFGGQTVLKDAPTPSALLDRIRAALDSPRLAGLSTIGVEDVSLRFDDVSRGHSFSSQDGFLRLDHARSGAIVLEADMGQLTGVAAVGTAPGHAGLRIDSPAPGQANGRLALRGVVPAEVAGIAGPSPLADLLARIEAPVSLTLSGQLDPDGHFGALDGTISVGEGLLDLPGRTRPFAVEAARGQMSLDSEDDHLSLTGLVLEAPDLSVRGRLDLTADSTGAQGGILVQAAFENLRATVPQFYDQPLELDGIWADLRYDRATDRLEIAGLSAQQGDTRLAAQGQILAGSAPGGPSLPGGVRSIALDLSTDRITPAALVALWPRSIAAGARDWIAERVEGGEFRQATAALRLAAGEAPEFGLSFDIADAVVRPVPALPAITGGQGMGQIAGRTLSIGIATARMAAPDGEPIALSEGDIQIPDIGVPNGELQVRFDAAADAGAAISLLTHPPFVSPEPEAPAELPLAPDDADGQVGLTVGMTIPLRKTTRFKDVTYSVAGAIDAFHSTKLLPGKTLAADRLQVQADPGRVVISGPASVDGQPITVTWSRPIAIDAPPQGSTVRAEGPLTEALAQVFGVVLPKGTLGGAGSVVADIALPPGGAAPQLKLHGELAGLSVSVPALGIAKAKGGAGSLDVTGRLGPAARLDPIRIAFPGLTLVAAADLVEGRGAESIAVKEIRAGRWLDARGTFWPGKGGGAPRVALSGGTVDIRYLPEGQGGSGGPGLSGIAVALDRVVVSDGIALTGVRGDLSGTVSGNLTGRVNGAAPVNVALAAQRGGTAVQVTASDAGNVLRAAKVFDTLHGGRLDLKLVPVGRSVYQGQARIADTALRDAPVMADLLSALSIVGALEQLAGEGIRFSDIRADFTLRPERIDVSQASAVGASIGLTAAGVFNLSRDTLDLKGVVSPVYFLNRAGGPRRGEGLIGFDYRLTGPMAKPSVSVNPLSVLVPGFLKDIVRGGPPQAVTRGEGN